MENTLENKAIFFALYWGQEVLKMAGSTDKLETVDFMMFMNNDHLILKPLLSVTDDDLHYVAELFGYTKIYEGNIQNAYYKAKQIISNIDYHPNSHCDLNKFLQLFDYFRLKGYALPWMGLSVKKLIEYGWIKFE